MTQISEYFAKIRFVIDKAEIKKVESAFRELEKKLKGSTKVLAEEAKAKNQSASASKNKASAVEKEVKAVDKLTKAQEKLNKAQNKSILEHRLSYLSSSPKSISASQKKMYQEMFGGSRAPSALVKAQQQAFVGAANSRLSYLQPSKQTPLRSLKDQQAMYNQLFGAVQQRQTQFATPAQIAAQRKAFSQTLNDRLSYLADGPKTQSLGDYYRNLEGQDKKRQEQALKNAAKLAEAEAKLKQKALDKERKDREKKEKDSIREMTRLHAEALADNRIFDADMRRRQQAEDKRRQAEQRLLERKERMERQREERFRKAQSRNSRANYLSMGGGSAAFMRYGVASLPLIGGMYGLASLNQANQELMSAEMANKATLGDQGERSLAWLRNQANTIGFNYLDQLPIFTSFMASGTPIMGYEQSRDVFSAMTQFGMTRGATSESMKRAMYAVSQMSAKGKITTEELNNQLSEARGFGESKMIFAEAYQRSIGGKLKGDEASAALIAAMAKGDAKPKDLLPLVAQIMKELSAGGITAASKTSGAEQNRFANAMTDLTRVFGQSGGEAGFASMWRGFTSQAEQSSGFVQKLGEGFRSAGLGLERLLSLQESFNNAIEGRDSQVADWLGPERTEQLRKDWAEIKALLGEIFSMDGPSWLPELRDVVTTLQTTLNDVAKISKRGSETYQVAQQIIQDEPGFKGLVKANWYTFKETMGLAVDINKRIPKPDTPKDSFAEYMANRQASFDTYTPTDPVAWRTEYDRRNKEAAVASFMNGRYSNGEFTPGNTVNENTFNVQFTVNGGTAEVETEFRTWVRTGLQDMLNETLPNYARSAQ